MNKNKILLTLFALGILVIAGISLFSSQKNRTSQPPAALPTIIPPSPTTFNIQKKINISGVQTNDFTVNPIASNKEGDIAFSQTGDYQLVYSKQYNDFTISISTITPQARKEAEDDFLKKLGISQNDACKLTVYVEQNYSPDFPESASKKLSFCQ